ncbi:serine/threonine-protein kinase STY13 [Pelomyxa schiedti]|nr:serine/threonine-protein kinase STY13 [Pelomyxa schiedti]
MASAAAQPQDQHDFEFPPDYYVVRGLEHCMDTVTKDLVRDAFFPHKICKVKFHKQCGIAMVKFQTRGEARNALALPHYTYTDSENDSVRVHLEKPGNQKKCEKTKRIVAAQKPQLPYRSPKLVVNFEKILGEGTYSSVYQGALEGRPVAVKVLNEGVRGKTDLQMSFDHPNLLSLLAVGEGPAPSQRMLILEFMPCTLYDILHQPDRVPGSMLRGLPLSKLKRLTIAREVARGVEFLHNTAHVVHRDIKVDNVLLDENWNVKLGDMGSCRHYDKYLGTVSGPDQKTIAYAAPEVLHGAPASTSSDIYSFAVFVWELFSGTRPYGTVDPRSVQASIMSGRHPPLHETFPSDVSALLRSCWAMDPKARPDISTVLEYITQIISRSNNYESGGSSFTTSSTTSSVASSTTSSRINRLPHSSASPSE